MDVVVENLDGDKFAEFLSSRQDGVNVAVDALALACAFSTLFVSHINHPLCQDCQRKLAVAYANFTAAIHGISLGLDESKIE